MTPTALELEHLSHRLLRRTEAASVEGVRKALKFEIVSEIEQVETIASGRGVRIRSLLQRVYGRGRWHKRKGVATVRLPNGAVRRVELHWYEAHGIGRRDFKIKTYLDEP